jgi:hypothetical protein
VIIFVILYKFFINSVLVFEYIQIYVIQVHGNSMCVSDFQRETQNRKSGGWIFNLSTQQQQQQRPTDRPTASTVVALYDKAAFIFDFGSFLRIEYNHDEFFSYQMYQSLSSDRITYNNCKGNVFVTR